MRSNLQVSFFDLKVRHRGSQPSIFVRTFRSFTIIRACTRLTAGIDWKVQSTVSEEKMVKSQKQPPAVLQQLLEQYQLTLGEPCPTCLCEL